MDSFAMINNFNNVALSEQYYMDVDMNQMYHPMQMNHMIGSNHHQEHVMVKEEPLPTYVVKSNVGNQGNFDWGQELFNNHNQNFNSAPSSSPNDVISQFSDNNMASSPTLMSMSGVFDLPLKHEVSPTKVEEPASPLINVVPTSRCIKSKRSPTNKCPCMGKDENCTSAGCRKLTGHFTCPVCGLEFSRKNSMRRHVLTHINLRPYECEACKKSFYRSDIYKRHLVSKKCKRNISIQKVNQFISHQIQSNLPC